MDKPEGYKKVIFLMFYIFFRYEGSLTTPACDEIVIWSVFESPIVVSPATRVAMSSWAKEVII